IFLATVYLLLRRYSRQEDIVLGLNPVEATPEGSTDLLPLRLHASEELTFLELVSRIDAATDTACSHRPASWESLLEIIQPTHDESYHPICQAAFSSSDIPNVSPSYTNGSGSNFDLFFRAIGSAKLEIVWAKDLFEAETIERMLGHWATLL